MKYIFRYLVLAGLLMGSLNELHAQQPTTIILLRHAEKDTSVAGSTQMQADPPLSKAGEMRAASLPNILKGYDMVDLVYSTNFVRTKATASPMAKKFGKEIQLYDPKDLVPFAKQLSLLIGKTVIVVGHSNTTPALVNLLIGEKTYPALEDNVYNTFWVVTIQDGKVKAKKVVY